MVIKSLACKMRRSSVILLLIIKPHRPDIRAGALTDYGSLTLLFQNKVSDLQVQRDGHWLDVPPMNGCIVVNIGDASKILDWRIF